jgi:hypothetical protein
MAFHITVALGGDSCALAAVPQVAVESSRRETLVPRGVLFAGQRGVDDQRGARSITKSSAV